ncbi:armadillo-type protein [Melampsora americana]|nr:armadillo-type protein [Melampsora americana]
MKANPSSSTFTSSATSNSNSTSIHSHSPFPSSESQDKLSKLSKIANKLITGVQPTSIQHSNQRWSASTNTSNPTHLPSNLIMKSNQIPITASSFAAAKKEREAIKHHHQHIKPFNKSNLIERSDQIKSKSTSHQIDHHSLIAFDDEDDHPNPNHHQVLIQQQSSSQFIPTSSDRIKTKSSAPPNFQTEEFIIPSNNLPQPLKPPTSSRFSRFKPTPNEAFLAVAYTSTTTTNQTPISPTNRSSFLSESDQEPATFEIAKRTQLPPSPIKAERKKLNSKSISISNPSEDFSIMRAKYLSQAKEISNGKRLESEKDRVSREFEKLMTAMDLPTTVRIKMEGLDHPVKSAMLKASSSSQLTSHSMIAQALKLSVSHQSTSDHHPHHPINLQESHQEERNGTEKDGPAWWAMTLKSRDFRALNPIELKRLRVALRTQAPTWTSEFLSYGGYTALMKRLKELLEIEWREEQHDDQVLFEILRCFKALLLSEPGKVALASRIPSPFVQLTNLLYSEKKPGELSSRQLLIELLHGLFELKITHETLKKSIDWTSSINLDQTNLNVISPNTSIDLKINHQFIKTLLIGAPDLKKEQMIEFVSMSHRKRPYKKLVTELCGVLMDYFWVFCHSENQYWELSELDEEKIESPKVPSGMTGGVEYEAMGYAAAVMRLINEFIRTESDLNEKSEIHKDLFESGFERALVTMRKSSMTYYPAIHLELARYLVEALKVEGLNEFKIPLNIMRHYKKNSKHLLNC